MGVRQLKPSSDDAALFRAVRLEALRVNPDAFASTLDREEAFDNREWMRRITLGHDGKPAAVFVDEVDGSPASPLESGAVLGLASVAYTEWDPSPMLGAMWVRPEARGSGVSPRLVDAGVAWATEQGATEIMLWVVAENAAAISLYEKCGFEASGKIGTMPNNPCVGELEMRRRLSD